MNVEKIRREFDVLQKGYAYFDNACMSLKPNRVVDKINQYYKEFPACGGRSSHKLSHAVDVEMLKARREVQKLISAKSENNCVFTRNTTEGINLVANGLSAGDEVIISDKEHNSNLIPWLHKKVSLKVVDSNEDGTFNVEHFSELLSSNTKFVSLTHTSNVDGVENPLKEVIKMAHDCGAKVLVDGAQGVPGRIVNVRKLDCDFLAFSGHKMMGPTGTGVLYGKEEALEELPQFLVGGETVVDSTYSGFTSEPVPMKFEAGLQDYANIMGLGEAALYLRKLGPDAIHKHEVMLNSYLTEALSDVDSLQIFGPSDATKRSGIFSFTLGDMDPHHISGMLNSSHIFTRSGAHCAHAWFNKHHLKGSTRASFYAYNTKEEVERFVDVLRKIVKLL